MTAKSSRRSFIKASALTGLTLAVTSNVSLAEDVMAINEKSLVFLFQGDSITDGNRGRSKDPNHIMGHGYAFAVASRVGVDFAESNHMFYNRGISGNKITDLEKRWKTDTLELKPDVLSILIGINDAAALVSKPSVNSNDIDLFSQTYHDLLMQCKEQNPDILFVLCMPFVYYVGKIKDNWEKYNVIVKSLSVIIKKLAIEFNAVVVDYNTAFEKAFKKAPVEYWIWDGIHPTVTGHEVMAREWIKQVSNQLKFLKKYKY